MPRRRPCHYNVRPRFSAGSPAMVSEEIALRVADDERENHARAAEGRYGNELQEQADDEHALYGIVYLLEEHPKFWRVYDLITEEERDVPFAQWRIEDALIRRKHAPSEAREVAEEIQKRIPRLTLGRSTVVLDTFLRTLAQYEDSKYEYPRERAISDSIFEATR